MQVNLNLSEEKSDQHFYRLRGNTAYSDIPGLIFGDHSEQDLLDLALIHSGLSLESFVKEAVLDYAKKQAIKAYKADRKLVKKGTPQERLQEAFNDALEEVKSDPAMLANLAEVGEQTAQNWLKGKHPKYYRKYQEGRLDRTKKMNLNSAKKSLEEMIDKKLAQSAS
jgi:uncharacterized protein (DUF1778 family)